MTIKTKLIVYFWLAILISMTLSAVLVNTSVTSVLENNMKLTSQQTLEETLKGFQVYLKTLSVPVDLLTRKQEVKHLEDDGDFDTNVSTVQDALVASLKVTDMPVRCYYATSSGYFVNAYLYDEEVDGVVKVKANKSLDQGVNKTGEEWYKNCIGSAKRQNIFSTFTEPYVDTETGNMIMTVSQEIKQDDLNVGAVGMDIDFTMFEKYVQDIRLLNTGFVLLVDADGNILVGNDNNTYIQDNVSNMGFWNNFLTDSVAQDAAKADAEENGTEWTAEVKSYEEKIGGSKFLVTVLEDEITGWKLVGMVQSDKENASSKTQLLISTIIAAVIGGLIGIIIAVVVALSLSKAIKRLQVATSRIAEGDFTGRLEVTRGDELGELEENFNQMVDAVSVLIREVEDKFSDVLNVATKISEVSNDTKETSSQVALAIQSVASGTTEQAQSTHDASVEVEKLAQSLEETRDYVENINQMSKATDELSTQGINVVGELVTKSNQTRENAQASSEIIGQMLKSIEKINYMSDAIASITEQTNLLSLNATIEAARAGESGRGFAVVADEIRKLAEQSRSSTDEIKSIIVEISGNSQQVTSNMEESNRLQAQQQEAIEATRNLFNQISEAVGGLLRGLEKISELNDNMAENKNTVVESMENIDYISEQSAAASEEVTASAEQVNYTMEETAEFAQNLNNIAIQLQEIIVKFKL
ncbi:methyl-accepting chemotaxis protein [Anaerosporobacter sp.]|uniref:methyl-accepting chemotaxis protein n=1 Tax=Anaerosporobacter sp. TaxID=1872529 RepID=UPI003FA4D19A